MSHHPDESKHEAVATFICGLPAVLVAAAAIGAVGYGNSRRDLISDYSKAATNAQRDGQLNEANLCYRKLVTIQPANRDFQFNLALVAEAQGNDSRASGLMSQIAPDDRAGFAPAHYWQAERLHKEIKSSGPMLKTIDRLEHHLVSTVRRDESHLEAQAMLGHLYLVKYKIAPDAKLLERSEHHLSQGVQSYPDSRLTLADVYRRLDKRQKAAAEANASLEHFSQQLDADPGDLKARLHVAAAQSFLLQFGSAIKTLSAGMELSDDPRLQQMLAANYVLAARAIPLKEPQDVGKRLALLRQALLLDPDNELILGSFAAVTAQSGPAADAARDILQDVLDSGRAPAIVHMILGTIAMQREQNDDASQHFEQALELNPKMPSLLNNYAWHLAHIDPPKLDRAVELANSAVQLKPLDREMRETRGQILFKLGRRQEAMKDLLIAVRAFPDRVRVHESLAAIYEQLGDGEMAERHRSRANPENAPSGGSSE